MIIFLSFYWMLVLSKVHNWNNLEKASPNTILECQIFNPTPRPFFVTSMTCLKNRLLTNFMTLLPNPHSPALPCPRPQLLDKGLLIILYSMTLDFYSMEFTESSESLIRNHKLGFYSRLLLLTAERAALIKSS